ncbi:Cdc6-like AAA superfamily ATPase [Pseudomonas sp. W3I7]|nr:Cdc6-like AAA superfamily ATPase [Pseudomonas sp. W3I7]
MTPLERSISERALFFAKANRTRIARELACLANYPGENYPVSVFMAGSPGAGKTEVSKSFIRLMEEGDPVRYVSTLMISGNTFLSIRDEIPAFFNVA